MQGANREGQTVPIGTVTQLSMALNDIISILIVSVSLHRRSGMLFMNRAIDRDGTDYRNTWRSL